MNTTDNTTVPENQEPRDDNQKTQEEIDREQRDQAKIIRPDQVDPDHPDRIVTADVPAPVSESQVSQGREVVDGNGQRETPDTEPTRPDVVVEPGRDIQRDHAKDVESRQNAKLDPNSKPSKQNK